MASICRLCATLRKTESFVNIHDASLEICAKLEKCCQYVVPRLNDVLPQNVCNECVINLNDCWKFFKRVHESQESLSKIFYISEDASVNSNTKYYEKNKVVANCSSSTRNLQCENNISSSGGNVHQGQNSEVATLLHNITIVGPDNEFTHSQSDNDSENDLKIEIAEQLTFEGLDDGDFAIATGTIINTDESQNELEPNCSNSHQISEIQLHPLNDPIDVNDRDDETETCKFVDQTMDQIENHLENEEYHNELIVENSNNLTGTDNSACSTLLSTSLSRSILMESLNEAELETLGSWADYNWKCSFCSAFTTESSKNLRLHIYTEHPDKQTAYVCTDCLKTFNRYYTFINHVKSRHRSQLQLCCDICSEFCANSNILAEHRSTAHIEEFNDETNRFRKSTTSEDDLAYCPDCAKAFRNKPALLVHMKGHKPSDEKYKFPCDFCEKIFATKANWKAHHKIHVGLKDFVCNLCGKGFVQKANLDEHKLTHSDNAPFQCEECNRKFKTSERLAKHISVHSDVKPHKCTICGSTFREKDTLRVHSRIHTGEMPYACDFCGKRFRFRSVLKTHRHQHTGERPYSCIECNHHFTNWPNYNKHMKRRHGTNASNGQANNSNININIIEEIENDDGVCAAPGQTSSLQLSSMISETTAKVTAVSRIPAATTEARTGNAIKSNRIGRQISPSPSIQAASAGANATTS